MDIKHILSNRIGLIPAVFGMAVSALADTGTVQEAALVVATAPVVQVPVRSPTLTLGGVKNGTVMVISEGGAASVTLAQLRQLQSPKPSPFSDFCRVQ